MTSPFVKILVIAVASIIVVAVFAFLMLPYQARLAAHTRLRRLRTLSIDELADEAKENATRCGLREQFAEASLFAERHWDPKSLSRALSELHDHAATADAADASVATDAESGKSSPNSWVATFHEFGLGAVLEATSERPNEDEPRFSARGSSE